MENNKSIKRNAFILALITLLVLYFVLRDDFDNIIDALLKWI